MTTGENIIDEQDVARLLEQRDAIVEAATRREDAAEELHLIAEGKAEELRQFLGACLRRFTAIGEPDLIEVASVCLDHAEQLQAHHLELLDSEGVHF